jgi:hypothetical protein
MPVQPDESLVKILERLAEEGCLQNNHKLDMRWPETEFDSRIVELICSMKNLENLDLSNHVLLPHVLAHILQSCSKITNLRLHMADFDCEIDEIFTMDEHLKSQLRPGFQRLQYFHIQCYIVEDTCLGFQEMLT